MYKVMVAMMVMAITTAPVFAVNKVDKNARPDKKEMRMNDRNHDKKVDKKTFKNNFRHAAVIEVVSFKVSNKASKMRSAVAKVHPWREGSQVEHTHQNDDCDLRCKQDFGTHHQGSSEMRTDDINT